MFTYNPDTDKLLQSLPRKQLQTIAQTLAEQSQTDLLCQSKRNLILFICYYQMLP